MLPLEGVGLENRHFAQAPSCYEDDFSTQSDSSNSSDRAKTIKKLTLASLLVSAAAVAPVSQKSTSTTLLNAFENELGAQAPLGFFDPFGLVADGEQDKFDRLRYVEIKHGRICMLGVVGYLVNAAGIYLPGDISYEGTKFSDLGYGWDASFAVPVAGALLFAFIGFLELHHRLRIGFFR